MITDSFPYHNVDMTYFLISLLKTKSLHHDSVMPVGYNALELWTAVFKGRSPVKEMNGVGRPPGQSRTPLFIYFIH